MRRVPRSLLGVAGLLVCLVVGVSVALAAGSSGTPAGGPIHLFVTPGQGQGSGKILITGAVGDYGSSSSVSAGAKKYGVASLTKGKIKIDLTAITKKVDNTMPTLDLATCSATLTATAKAPVVSGTGLYAGIHGSIKITESFGFIGPFIKSGPNKGQCNTSDSAPTVAQMGTVYGSGTVSF